MASNGRFPQRESREILKQLKQVLNGKDAMIKRFGEALQEQKQQFESSRNHINRKYLETVEKIRKREDSKDKQIELLEQKINQLTNPHVLNDEQKEDKKVLENETACLLVILYDAYLKAETNDERLTSVLEAMIDQADKSKVHVLTMMSIIFEREKEKIADGKLERNKKMENKYPMFYEYIHKKKVN